jgi:hypothetical protein
MCIGKGNGSLSTSLQRKALHLEDGVVGSVEGLVSFFKSSFGTSAFCLVHNPINIRVRTRLTNSKISWTDIQFALSKLTAVMRGSSPDCGVDKETLVYSVAPGKQKNSKKGKYQTKCKKASKITEEEEEEKGYSMYLQQQ